MVESAPVEELTPREAEVLDLLRRGLTNGEIAQRLDVSADAAKYHVSQIIGKLGVRNRHEAAVWPKRSPWWAAALAPIAVVWRKIGAGWLPAVAAGGVAVAVAAGIGVLVWALVRTNGTAGPVVIPSSTPAGLVYVGGTIDSISDQQLVVRDGMGRLVPIGVEHAEGPEAQFCRHATPLDICMILSEAAPARGEEVCVMAYLMPGGPLLVWLAQLDAQCRFVSLTPTSTPQ